MAGTQDPPAMPTQSIAAPVVTATLPAAMPEKYNIRQILLEYGVSKENINHVMTIYNLGLSSDTPAHRQTQSKYDDPKKMAGAEEPPAIPTPTAPTTATSRQIKQILLDGLSESQINYIMSQDNLGLSSDTLTKYKLFVEHNKRQQSKYDDPKDPRNFMDNKHSKKPAPPAETTTAAGLADRILGYDSAQAAAQVDGVLGEYVKEKEFTPTELDDAKNVTFMKVMLSSENHRGVQYKTGLNTLKPGEKFARLGTKCAGRLYFARKEHIHRFLSRGTWLRMVTLPENAQKVEDEYELGADRIILGNRYSLFDPKTYQLFGLKMEDHRTLVECAINGLNKEFLEKWKQGQFPKLDFYYNKQTNWNGYLRECIWEPDRLDRLKLLYQYKYQSDIEYLVADVHGDWYLGRGKIYLPRAHKDDLIATAKFFVRQCIELGAHKILKWFLKMAGKWVTISSFAIEAIMEKESRWPMIQTIVQSSVPIDAQESTMLRFHQALVSSTSEKAKKLLEWWQEDSGLPFTRPFHPPVGYSAAEWEKNTAREAAKETLAILENATSGPRVPRYSPFNKLEDFFDSGLNEPWKQLGFASIILSAFLFCCVSRK